MLLGCYHADPSGFGTNMYHGLSHEGTIMQPLSFLPLTSLNTESHHLTNSLIKVFRENNGGY